MLFKGSRAYPQYDSDTNYNPMKFEATFQYLFGVMEPDIDACIEVDEGRVIFIIKD